MTPDPSHRAILQQDSKLHVVFSRFPPRLLHKAPDVLTVPGVNRIEQRGIVKFGTRGPPKQSQSVLRGPHFVAADVTAPQSQLGRIQCKLRLFAALKKGGLGALPDRGNVLEGANRAANHAAGIAQRTGVAPDYLPG